MANIHKVSSLPSSYGGDDLVFVSGTGGVDFMVPSKEANKLHGVVPPITLNGPTVIHTDSVYSYQLTAPTDESPYILSSADGTLVYNAENYSFTFQVTDPLLTSATIDINTQKFVLTVLTAYTAAPVVEYPANLSENVDPAGLVLVSSAFALTNPAATDTHLSSDWEISTDPDFVNIVASSYNDQVNLTTFPVPSN